jgi:hypothetical protein
MTDFETRARAAARAVHAVAAPPSPTGSFHTGTVVGPPGPW